MTLTSGFPSHVNRRVTALRRVVTAIEPWYNWGEIHVERMQELRLADGSHVQAGGEGPVRFVEVQWFGIHLALQFGRTPKAVR